VQPSRKAKNPNTRKTNSPVDPTQHITSVGLTGDRKNSTRDQKPFFQPAFFEKLDDWRIKSSQKKLKICRHDHKDLVNISTEGIDESLHDLRGIEEFPSKNGVFSRTHKLRFERARES